MRILNKIRAIKFMALFLSHIKHLIKPHMFTKTKNKNSSAKEFYKFSLLIFFLITGLQSFTQICSKPFHIVILGSSTAYGNGATPISKAWAYLYTDSLKRIDTNYIVDNLAIPGTTTYAAQPDNYIPPPGRPAPIQGNNISAAIRLHADAIIVNYPSNDAVNNYTLAEQQANFKRISNTAKKHGILIWITTPQPRNQLTAAQVSSQKKLYNWIMQYYKEKAIDFHTGLASDKDSILFKYNSGDGIHVNDAGHHILYNRVTRENIPDSLCKLNQVFQFAIKKTIDINADMHSSSAKNSQNPEENFSNIYDSFSKQLTQSEASKASDLY